MGDIEFTGGGAGAGMGAMMPILGTMVQLSETRRARAWNEYMAGTAYQRMVADMRKAGLNPMLAFDKGPGGFPSAQVPDTSGLAEGGRQMQQNVMNQATRALMEAQNQSYNATASAARAQAENTEKDTEIKEIDRARRQWEFDRDQTIWQATGKAQISEILNSAGITGSTARQRAAQAEIEAAAIPQAKQEGDYIQAISDTIEKMVGKGAAADIMKVVIPALLGKLTDSAIGFAGKNVPGRPRTISTEEESFGPRGYSKTRRRTTED